MDIYEESLILHERLKGKIEITLKEPIADAKALSLLYSPGVAQPCLNIKNNPDDVYKYTMKSNMVAIISDGSAVLGLGNIKAKAALPVMEGKAALIKEFAGVNAFPICLDTQDDDEIINIVKNIACNFGGINLEDINAPRCFHIEKTLDEMLDIPVFHDDQHGTAIVCLAGLINALKVVNKNKDIKILINGLGSAGIAITKLFVEYGFNNFSLCDRDGELYGGRLEKNDLNNLVEFIENEKLVCNHLPLKQAIKQADVFIGVSAANILDVDMVKSMSEKPIIFAMANPSPELSRENAQASNVAIYATGRSDYPNQINNVLVFPGLFKGALEVQASTINTTMKLAAVQALVDIIPDDLLNEEYIIPSPFDKQVVEKVSEAIKKAAIESKVARV